MRENAARRWEKFCSEDVENLDLDGHLLPYPITVTQEGEVKHLEGHETFLDVGGNVLGSSQRLPVELTT